MTLQRKDNVPKPFAPLHLSVFVLSLCIILLAAALRFHNLGTQSLWNDEGNSYVQATRSFADIASNAARDIHPPGYYWLLAIWHDLMGSSEVALRTLSTLASILSVALTFALGRRLFNPTAGLAAALLVSLNTFSIYYAQEARMYALLALWGAAGMWALVSLLKNKPNVGTRYIVSASSLKWSLALAFINTAGLYTQYAYPFIMLAQGVVFLLMLLANSRTSPPSPLSVYREGEQEPKVLAGRTSSPTASLLWFVINPIDRSASRGNLYTVIGTYIASNLFTLFLFLPWLPTALRQVTQWPSTGTPIPASEALGIIGGWFTLGITYEAVPNAVNYLPFALLLLSGGVVSGLWLGGRTAFWSTLMPVMWAGLPVALFLALGLFRPANLKFLLPAQIGFALLTGAGIGGWWAVARRGHHLDRITLILTLLQALWLLVYLSNGLQPLYSDPHFQRADYRGMVRAISANPRDGDAIILDAPNQEEVFRYYYQGTAPIYPLPAGLGGDDAQTLIAVQNIIRQHRRIFVLFWGETERDPNHIIENTLDSTIFEAGQDKWYGDVRFAQYVTPVTMPDSKPVFKRFGDLILLERAAISGRTFRPGDVMQVRLEWRSDGALDKRYKVFLQLLNAGGVLVAQRDSEPAGGSQPTTTWQPNAIINDQHGLALPPNLAPGDYQIIVGLYDRDDPNQRLLVGEKTYVTLGKIAIIVSAT